jgi:hypothetical protein
MKLILVSGENAAAEMSGPPEDVSVVTVVLQQIGRSPQSDAPVK